ncbi:MAG: hypothetical protein LRS43_04350 [Desulfurococcales archaeon]|nr:hypothetical protein [Desulfurococcales archaeon]
MRYRELKGLKGGSVYDLSSSLDHDVVIARHAALVTAAHLRELNRLGYISSWALEKSLRVLRRLYESPGSIPRKGYEDVFEYIESMLEEAVGGEALWLPLGRSRNDHVAAALRLYVAESTLALAEAVAEASEAMLEKARETLGTPMIGFTHGEPAFIHDSSCLFLAYAESLADSLPLLAATLEASLKSPLYAAGGAGTLAPVDEGRVSRMLGFKRSYHSPYYAVASRGFLEASALSIALVCAEASRIAEDLVVLHGLRLVRIPEEHVATSSYMPHKENPVTLETARALSSKCVSLAYAVASILSKLRYSYNLDFQEASKAYTESLESALMVLKTLGDAVAGAKVAVDNVHRIVRETAPCSSEEAEYNSMRSMVPMRLEYARLAKRRPAEASPAECLKLAAERRTGCVPDKVPGRIDLLEATIKGYIEGLRREFPGIEHLYKEVMDASGT